jgi:aspartyl-tRNA(Asn)/glutamyl-tRNA(Gln) amidotransferase subunit A
MMTMAEQLSLMPIAKLARLFRDRQASPVDLIIEMLGRIERLNPRLNAYITVLNDHALAAARQAEVEIRRGDYLGPLHGIPIALKDLYLTQGILTTAGSRILAGWKPDDDATVVTRLRDAGAIIIGKTNMHEFAMGPTNINPHFGDCLNPWDVERVTGGSSGGSGAAVSTSMATAALGSDTGGSIRIPSSLCGITGHKPTYGLVSRYGVLALSWSLDHAGPMTKTVEDAALMMNTLAGYDARDPASAYRPVPDYRDALNGNVRGLKAGVPRGYFFENLDAEVSSALEDALEVLQGLGMKLQEVDFPHPQLCSATTMAIAWAESCSYHEQFRDKANQYGEDVRSRLEVGRTILATDYLRAQRVRRAICEKYRELMRTVDVLVTPTIRIPAPRIADCKEIPVVGASYDQRMVLSALTRPFNVTGAPSLTVPCGFTAERLPIGMQISGAPYGDEKVLQVGHAYQIATTWHQQHPRV